MILAFGVGIILGVVLAAPIVTVGKKVVAEVKTWADKL